MRRLRSGQRSRSCHTLGGSTARAKGGNRRLSHRRRAHDRHGKAHGLVATDRQGPSPTPLPTMSRLHRLSKKPLRRSSRRGLGRSHGLRTGLNHATKTKSMGAIAGMCKSVGAIGGTGISMGAIGDMGNKVFTKEPETSINNSAFTKARETSMSNKLCTKPPEFSMNNKVYTKEAQKSMTNKVFATSQVTSMSNEVCTKAPELSMSKSMGAIGGIGRSMGAIGGMGKSMSAIGGMDKSMGAIGGKLHALALAQCRASGLVLGLKHELVTQHATGRGVRTADSNSQQDLQGRGVLHVLDVRRGLLQPCDLGLKEGLTSQGSRQKRTKTVHRHHLVIRPLRLNSLSLCADRHRTALLRLHRGLGDALTDVEAVGLQLDLLHGPAWRGIAAPLVQVRVANAAAEHSR